MREGPNESLPIQETTHSLPLASPESSNERKRGGMGWFVFFQVAVAISFVIAGVVLVRLHERYQKAEGRTRAVEIARYELGRMTQAFNYRLGELREQMLHLYGEQLNLGRALTEAERERLIFFRRDHLAAYGILVAGEENKWELQKYYVRETAKAGVSEEIAKILKETMAAAPPPGFGIRRAQIAWHSLGVNWSAAGQSQGLAEEAYAVGFSALDDNGKPFGVVGVFRPSYVFSFCREFSEALGKMPLGAFVLNDQGIALCHSQPRYDGTSFKEYSFYRTLNEPAAGEFVRYTNLLNDNVTAAVKRVELGGVVFVAEAVEVRPWVSAVPYQDLGLIAGGLVAAVLLFSSLAGRVLLGRGAAAREAPLEMPRIDSLGVELGEFTKLRLEVKELEQTVLEMQSNSAFVAGFQSQIAELPATESAARFTAEYLASWGAPMVWLAYDRDVKSLSLGARAGWGSEPVTAFQIDAGEIADPSAGIENAELRAKITRQLGRNDVHLQPVRFGRTFFGLVVAAGVKDLAPSRLELLPQLAQILAIVLQSRVLRDDLVATSAKEGGS